MKFIILMLLVSCSCKPIKYLSDNTPSFMSSAEANSYEFPTIVNGILCNLCSIQFKKKDGMNIFIEKRPYSYKLQINCTSNIGYSKEFTISSNESFSLKLSEEFNDEELFICSGIISPRDRPEGVSAKFQITGNIINENYEKREEIYRDENLNVIFGERAYYSTCNGKTFSKLTIADKTCSGFVFSESEKMRFNYGKY